MTDSYYSSPDQSIPFSPEAEEALLGAVLTNINAYYNVAAFVRAEDFYLLRHRWIWQAVARIVERGEAYDFLTVGQELRGLNRFEEVGGQPYLLHLISNTPTFVHAEVYGRLVERAALRRRLLEASDHIRLLALDEEKAIETVTEEAESYLLKVTESQLKRDIVPIRDAVGEYFARIEHLIANRDLALGLPTTFKALDTLLGGLQKSDLLIFAGRPGMGKTAFMLSVALNAARFEKRIAIFTMEMGAEQIVQRLISMETGINMQKLRLGQIDHAEWQRLVEAVGRLSRFNIFIDDTPAMTPLQMRTKCRRLAHEHGVDLVIVDYIQLMNAGGIYENNRVQEVSYISRSLKELARELNVPVFSAAQLSRAVEQRQDKRPQLSDLRESGCLAGDSRVYLPDTGRYVPIRDLNGQSGFRVLSLNTTTRRLESAAVSHAFCTGVKPVYRLRTRLGRSIRATANHKFYTITGWKRLDELTVGDHIALPTLPDITSQPFTGAGLSWKQPTDLPPGSPPLTQRGEMTGHAGVITLHSTTMATELGSEVSTSDIYWDAVLAVEPDGESDVYDLTVPGNSSFVADNIVVHNSIEQDADIVMFLYRDEVYNEATEHPNQADIIVAKHRNGPTGVVSLYFDKSITRFLDSTRHSVDLSHHT